MSLEEYLKENLNLSLEEAKKIVDLFHSYKREYGHHHFHEGNSHENDSIKKVQESEEFCQLNNYELEKLHCNCCPSHCLLSQPNCGRGKSVQEEVLTKQNH